jgi:hypothetical protein
MHLLRWAAILSRKPRHCPACAPHTSAARSHRSDRSVCCIASRGRQGEVQNSRYGMLPQLPKLGGIFNKNVISCSLPAEGLVFVPALFSSLDIPETSDCRKSSASPPVHLSILLSNIHLCNVTRAFSLLRFSRFIRSTGFPPRRLHIPPTPAHRFQSRSS